MPSGRAHAIDYTADPPVLAVKLQELFGLTATPTVDEGRVPLVAAAPVAGAAAGRGDPRPGGFWATGYPAVRKELRGRYPKHPWPEDPLAAPATHRAGRASSQ